MNYRFLHRKDTMLISAIDILDKGGIQGLTTKEIAKAEGVTEAAVYKHYTGKQEIIAAILERFASFDHQICDTILQQQMSEREGILFYAKAYAEYYQGYPQIATLLFSFDVFRYDPDLKRGMLHTMEDRRAFLEQFITDCRTAAGTTGRITPPILAGMILGCIWNSTYYWKLNDESHNLKAEILESVQALLNLLEVPTKDVSHDR